VSTSSEVDTISSLGSASQSLGRRNFTFLRARICRICVHATCDAVARPRATAVHSHVCVPRIHACITRICVCTRASLHVCTRLSYFVRSKDNFLWHRAFLHGARGTCVHVPCTHVCMHVCCMHAPRPNLPPRLGLQGQLPCALGSRSRLQGACWFHLEPAGSSMEPCWIRLF
jgi:hypothetical protein